MATKVELNLSVIWAMKPDGLIRLMNDMKAVPYELDIIYNWEFEIFTTTCRFEDEDDIVDYFHDCLKQIEQDIEDNEEGEIYDSNLSLLTALPVNPWIDCVIDQGIDNLSATYEQLRFPAAFKHLPCRRVWTRLYRFAGLIIDHFLTRNQLEALRNQHNATIETDLHGTEIYIGAKDDKDVVEVGKKLDHLLINKCMTEPGAAHILFTESYKEKDGCEVTIEARFMAHIDVGLIRTTLFDLGVSMDSAFGYGILANGITLRLCRWDSEAGYHKSYIGPEVKPRQGSIGNGRFALRNHIVSSKQARTISVPPKENPTLREQERDTVSRLVLPGVGGPSLAGVEVEKWLKTVQGDAHESSASSIEASVGLTSAGGLPSILEGILIDLSTTDDVQPTQVPQKDLWPDLQGIYINQTPTVSGTSDITKNLCGPESYGGAVGSDPVQGILNSHSGSTDAGSEAPSTNGGSSATDHLPVFGKQYASRKLGKSALTPPVSVHSSSRRLDLPQTRVPSAVVSTGARSITANSVASSTSRARRQTGVEFAQEIHFAVSKLVEKGPYLRGQVSLRFELGRVIVVGMDYSGISFNEPSFRSNGWRKSRLLSHLNHANAQQGLLFTQLLTQDGSDIDFMTKITDLDLRKPLWKDEATETKLYSFLCIDRQNGREDCFFVDVEVDLESTGYKYTLRTKNDDKAPIWVHGVLRNWDARIVMSHVDSPTLEDKHGAFAKKLVASMTFNKVNKLACLRVVGAPGIDIVWMRVRTLWRFPSADGMSYFNVTEVQLTAHKVIPCTKKGCHCVGVVHEFSPRQAQITPQTDESQEPGRWYEAFITSASAEKLLAENSTMAFGEKANWDFATLKKEKAVDALYRPGLRMVQTIDSVGAHNDNHRVDKMDLPRKDYFQDSQVPGANYANCSNRVDRFPGVAQRGPSLSRMSVASVSTMDQTDGFVQTAPPPGSVRGSVRYVVAARENGSAARREIPSYRLKTAPPSRQAGPTGDPPMVPAVTGRAPLATTPQRPAAAQNQQPGAPYRSPSVVSSTGQLHRYQASSRPPGQTFW